MHMEDSQQNGIEIKASKDLYLKIGIGWCIKSKIYCLFDSHKNKWKRLQWNFQLHPMTKIG